MISPDFEDAYFVAPWLDDWEWLQVMQDLEELDFSYETMAFNLKMRPHLAREKRLLLLDQLIHFC